jgi:hypothetical protein
MGPRSAMNSDSTLHSKLFLEAFAHIKWMAETVHQVYHQRDLKDMLENTYRTCDESVCKATQDLIMKWAQDTVTEARQ